MAGIVGQLRSTCRLDSVWTQAKRHGSRQAHAAPLAMEKSFMTFERAWVLIFLLLPLRWMVYEMRRTRRTLALLLKTIAFLAVVLALAEPKLTIPETKMAVAILVYTSPSASA